MHRNVHLMSRYKCLCVHANKGFDEDTHCSVSISPVISPFIVFVYRKKKKTEPVQSTKSQSKQTYGLNVKAQVLVEHVKFSWSHWGLRGLTGRWCAACIRPAIKAKWKRYCMSYHSP